MAAQRGKLVQWYGIIYPYSETSGKAGMESRGYWLGGLEGQDSLVVHYNITLLCNMENGLYGEFEVLAWRFRGGKLAQWTVQLSIYLSLYPPSRLLSVLYVQTVFVVFYHFLYISSMYDNSLLFNVEIQENYIVILLH